MTGWKSYLPVLEKDFGLYKDAYITAADGGIKNCLSAKADPDAVIGDMDSIDQQDIRALKSDPKDTDFIKYGPDKDESDAQLALEHTAGKVKGKIAVVGALGKRLDHALANIYLLAAPALIKRDIHIFSQYSDVFVTDKTIEISGSPGKRVTLISISPYTYFISSSGLKYPLEQERLYQSPVRGLSNAFIADYARLDITEGILLILKEL